MEIPIKVQELLNKKAAEDGIIDLSVYELGLTDMYNLLNPILSNKFPDGYTARVIDRQYGHNFAIGEIITVVYRSKNEYDEYEQHWCCTDKDRIHTWFLCEDEMELITE